MTEVYTTQHPTNGIIRKLHSEPVRLDADDELYYDFLKRRLDALLIQPHPRCIRKITSYSKNG